MSTPTDPYDDGTDDATATSPYAVIQPQLTVGDPDRANRFLSEHRGRASAAESQFSDIMRQRQEAIAHTQKVLDETIQTLRDRHEGKGLGQVNLPLIALGAGLLQGEEPGKAGNFGRELSRGLAGMGKAVQTQRMGDDEFYKGLAELQAKQGQLSDIPLRDAAAFAKAQSLKEAGDQGAIEKALITSKADQPHSMGAGLIFDPKTNKIVNAYTNEEVSLDPSKMTDANGKSLLGSDVHGEEFLKSITNPSLRAAIKGWGDYDAVLPAGSRSPASMGFQQQMFALAKQYNPDFDAKNYPTIQKGMASWTGQGQNAQMQRSVTATSEHMGNMQSTAAGLDNTDFTLINKAGNLLKAATGSPRIAAFLAAKQAAITELSAFLGKGHPAEGQINAWSHTVDEANSPAALQAALEQYASIMHGQAVALARAKTNDLHKEFKPEDIFGTDTNKRLQSILSYDIATPGGRLAALRRGQNDKLTQLGKEPLPVVAPSQWEAAAKDLKKAPTKEMRAQFDGAFGPGSAAMVLGR